MKPFKGGTRSTIRSPKNPATIKVSEAAAERAKFRAQYERGAIGKEPPPMNRAERRRARRHMRRNYHI